MKSLPTQLVTDREPTLSRIRDQLENHSHFRGRAHLFRIELLGDAIVVSGRVPTYYLKQLLQEAIRAIPDVPRVENRVDVLFQQSQTGFGSRCYAESWRRSAGHSVIGTFFNRGLRLV